MKETKGNLFDQACDAICITTNGFTKSNGEAVMGKGCALRASEIWPIMPARLGELLRDHGNRVMRVFKTQRYNVVTFPVKARSEECLNDKSNVVKHQHHRFQPGDIVPGWACTADPVIIQRSAIQLVEMADKFGWSNVFLPRPGCGAGELEWKDIQPILSEILDDRFTAITF